MSKISVLMSLYDKENVDFLTLCFDSLVQQTRRPDQVVIVFDGPLNQELGNAVDVFAELLPITKVRLDKNSGLAIALNEGLKRCTGELVARMDTDDICMHDRLEKQERYLLDNNLDIVGTAASVIDLSGRLTGSRVNPVNHDEIIAKLWCNPFIHPSVMFKKNKIQSIGSYNSSLRRRQDYELWFRAAKHGLKFGNLDEKLINYRFDHHTLKKQSAKLAWKQGTIGFKGSQSCNLGIVKSLACYVPFLRSLLPFGLQIRLTKLMKAVDSRAK